MHAGNDNNGSDNGNFNGNVNDGSQNGADNGNSNDGSSNGGGRFAEFQR